jgi:hypothetical protein
MKGREIMRSSARFRGKNGHETGENCGKFHHERLQKHENCLETKKKNVANEKVL